jgi:hypothetical protein
MHALFLRFYALLVLATQPAEHEPRDALSDRATGCHIGGNVDPVGDRSQ